MHDTYLRTSQSTGEGHWKQRQDDRPLDTTDMCTSNSEAPQDIRTPAQNEATVRVSGDSERQAVLRDQSIKKRRKPQRSIFVSGVLAALDPAMKLLDIGCGTAHIIQELAASKERSFFLGCDVSTAMIRIAKANAARFHNIRLVKGDGLNLPFPSDTFDIVVTRLAEYSPEEAYRVLRQGGWFFEYGLGPEADREIRECFPRRIERRASSLLETRDWKQEVCEDIVKVGFVVSSVDDYWEADYYESEEDLMDLIEMVPLVRQFDRRKDRAKIEELVETYGSAKGVPITWHYYVLRARKP